MSFKLVWRIPRFLCWFSMRKLFCREGKPREKHFCLFLMWRCEKWTAAVRFLLRVLVVYYKCPFLLFSFTLLSLKLLNEISLWNGKMNFEEDFPQTWQDLFSPLPTQSFMLILEWNLFLPCAAIHLNGLYTVLDSAKKLENSYCRPILKFHHVLWSLEILTPHPLLPQPIF